jgi:alpha-mannosidase
MPVFEETCVLIPAATLEDFPTDLSDDDARSLLAGWSVLWHPRLLAATGQLPAWARGDAPPEAKSGQLVVVPTPSLPQLPADYLSRAAATEGAVVLTGGSRAEFLTNLANAVPDPDWTNVPMLQQGDREIGVADFYAAGYAFLQIQVMTRRLRYTSNLDEIQLQKRLIDAATGLLAADASGAIAALHDFFDALAQERDHYFSSSDPHLIDLTLVSPSTVDALLCEIDGVPASTESDDRLSTPTNVLIDQSVAAALCELDEPRTATLRSAIATARVGWAGGGPPASLNLDGMTLCQAHRAIAAATDRCRQATGVSPTVFARFSGGWSGDMNWALPPLGYRGVIPLDFAAGTGYGDEAKVLLEAGGVQIEALTVKPIDASSEAAFLGLGAKLGQAIDGGEIATALFAHWPGQGSDSFADVRRAASWSLCLGRFWKLHDYFCEGEHPYHHGTVPATAKSSAAALDHAVEQRIPLTKFAAEFCDAVKGEQQQLITGLGRLIRVPSGGENSDPSNAAAIDTTEPVPDFVAAVLGKQPPNSDPNTRATMIINSASIGWRETLSVDHGVATEAKQIFAASPGANGMDVTVDVPSCGFVVLGGRDAAKPNRKTLTQRLFGRGRDSIATRERSDGTMRLQNEFMEVVIHPTSGGIAGVYSGAIRGNRFSLKLIAQQASAAGTASETEMQSDAIELISTTAARGSVQVNGKLLAAKSAQPAATFQLVYVLERGSRVLRVEGELTPQLPISGSVWQNYVAARAAVSGETAIMRPIVRDKIHRHSTRQIFAPLGVVIDESERQTLVAAHGLPFHRHVSDRFLDTLLAVTNDGPQKFRLDYAFDVPSPVATARALIASPQIVPVSAAADTSSIGWLLHASPKTLQISKLDVALRGDGRLAAIIRVAQTQPQPCTAVVRFLRDVETAIRLDRPSDDPINDPINAPLSELETRHPLATEGDHIRVPLPVHGVVDLLVVFRDSNSA